MGVCGAPDAVMKIPGNPERQKTPGRPEKQSEAALKISSAPEIQKILGTPGRLKNPDRLER